MADALLAVDRVSCWFGGLKAVDGASLTAPSGRITALIGPNGAGKSTLFNCISGFLRPDDGRIELAGRRIISVEFAPGFDGPSLARIVATALGEPAGRHALARAATRASDERCRTHTRGGARSPRFPRSAPG